MPFGQCKSHAGFYIRRHPDATALVALRVIAIQLKLMDSGCPFRVTAQQGLGNQGIHTRFVQHLHLLRGMRPPRRVVSQVDVGQPPQGKKRHILRFIHLGLNAQPLVDNAARPVELAIGVFDQTLVEQLHQTLKVSLRRLSLKRLGLSHS